MRQPFKRKDTGCWHLQQGTRQINLGRDKEAAFQEYHRIMAEKTADDKPTAWDSLPVQMVIAAFLTWVKANRKPATYQFYRIPLLNFAKFVGPKLKTREVRPFHITRWMAACFQETKRRKKKDGSFTTPKPVSDNHRHNGIRAVKECFAWAKAEGHLQTNALAEVKNYPTTRRDTYINPDQFETLMAAIRQTDVDFREFVLMMRLTGCRPQEVRHAEKRHYDRASQSLDFPAGEIKGSKEMRVVLLEGESLAIVERRMARYATDEEGHLFRNSMGKPWTKDAIVQRFTDLSAKAGFKVTSYTIRHAWATDALARGVPIQFVAKIMGHKGTRVLMEVYSHLELKKKELREALSRANGALQDNPAA